MWFGSVRDNFFSSKLVAIRIIRKFCLSTGGYTESCRSGGTVIGEILINSIFQQFSLCCRLTVSRICVESPGKWTLRIFQNHLTRTILKWQWTTFWGLSMKWNLHLVQPSTLWRCAGASLCSFWMKLSFSLGSTFYEHMFRFMLSFFLNSLFSIHWLEVGCLQTGWHAALWSNLLSEHQNSKNTRWAS